MNIYSAVDTTVKYMAERLEREGLLAVTAGNNGPYYNEETVVRNYAHWCAAFSEYYLHTGEERYLSLVRLLAEGIYNSECYNGNGVYKCREAVHGDEVNGVIGPAWLIEGLVYAARATGESKYFDRALKLFRAVPYNKALGIWGRRNTRNEAMSVDTTFNHQLWFAASGAMLLAYDRDKLSDVEDAVKGFTDRLKVNITIRENGRIAHFTFNDKNGILGYFGRIYRDIRNDIEESMNKPSLAYKELGYHAFNLYGFAILKENLPWKVPFFDSARFKSALAYAGSMSYVEALNNCDRQLDSTRVKSKLEGKYNLFAYAYNSPAFELPRVFECFNYKPDEGVVSALSDKQLSLTYSLNERGFVLNTDDPVTLTARAYELIAGAGIYFDGLHNTEG